MKNCSKYWSNLPIITNKPKGFKILKTFDNGDKIISHYIEIYDYKETINVSLQYKITLQDGTIYYDIDEKYFKDEVFDVIDFNLQDFKRDKYPFRYLHSIEVSSIEDIRRILTKRNRIKKLKMLI